MSTTIRLGGRDVVVPPLPIRALRKCWSDIKALAVSSDRLEMLEAMARIVAAGCEITQPDVTLSWLEDNVTPGDTEALNVGITAILRESGMAPREDATPGGVMATSSTETGTVSSPSS